MKTRQRATVDNSKASKKSDKIKEKSTKNEKTSEVVAKSEAPEPDAAPSIEDLRQHIANHFPTFDMTQLIVPEKKITFQKGVTPTKTPKSYYINRPPHSYSKGFKPTA